MLRCCGNMCFRLWCVYWVPCGVRLVYESNVKMESGVSFVIFAIVLRKYAASKPWRPQYWQETPWEPQILRQRQIFLSSQPWTNSPNISSFWWRVFIELHCQESFVGNRNFFFGSACYGILALTCRSLTLCNYERFCDNTCSFFHCQRQR